MRAVKDSLPAPSREGKESERPRSTGAVEPTAGIFPIESGKRITEAAWKGLLCSRNARPQKGWRGKRGIENWNVLARAIGTSGKSIAKQSEGRACEKVNDESSMSQVMSQPRARRDCRHPEPMAENGW